MTGNPGMILVRIPADLEGTLTERPAFYDPAWGLIKPRYSDTEGHRLPGFYLANEQFFRVLRLMSQLSQKELSTCGKWDSVESMKLIAVAVPGEVLLTPAEGQVQESLVLANKYFVRLLKIMGEWSQSDRANLW